MLLCTLAVVTSLAAAADSAEEARALEERAFTAIDDERWCEAYGAFLAAHERVPREELLENAAQAARLGDDRDAALALFGRLLTSADARVKAEARKHLDEVAAEIEAQGKGAACPPLVAEEPAAVAEAPAAAVEPESAPAPAGDDDGLSMFLVLGGVGVALGALLGAGTFASGLLLEYAVIRNASAPGDLRATAVAVGPWAVGGGAVASLGVAFVGGALLSLWLLE